MSRRIRSCIWQGPPYGFMKKTSRGSWAFAPWACEATGFAGAPGAAARAPRGSARVETARRAARRTGFMWAPWGEGGFGPVGAGRAQEDSSGWGPREAGEGEAIDAGRDPS